MTSLTLHGLPACVTCTIRAKRSFNLGENSLGKALSQRTLNFQVLARFEVSSLCLSIQSIPSLGHVVLGIPWMRTPAGNSEHRTLHLTQGSAQCQKISLGYLWVCVEADVCMMVSGGPERPNNGMGSRSLEAWTVAHRY